MDDPPRIRVLLLADGRVMMPEGDVGPGASEATWEVLGRIRHDGEPMAFVRAEMAGSRGRRWSGVPGSRPLTGDRSSP
jgi:hypothetical protein